ncbi:MAG: 30S ribosomal protein S6, partial [Clostridia bacterium]|nr:30S ribosomal protein S6 [Clostridia bacterium]
ESVENMGKKKLAYEIKKFSEATYMLFNFEAKPDSITELERVYRITDDIIKFIVVRKED